MKNTVKVNPDRIRALRDKAHLTQAKLAEKMRVDTGTVSRWERGEICDVRRDTLGRLCMVLGASEADICGEGPGPETNAAQQAPQKRQMNLSIDMACRNALALVARRYGVTRQQIVEAAPLLFLIVAEKSLQERRKRLDGLWDAAEILNAVLIPGVSADENALSREQEAIKSRDLFWGYSFSAFLSKALASVCDAAESVEWNREEWEEQPGSPIYRICTAEAAALVGDDEVAVNAILSGAAALKDMPSIRKSSPAERAQWARSEGERYRNTPPSAEADKIIDTEELERPSISFDIEY